MSKYQWKSANGWDDAGETKIFRERISFDFICCQCLKSLRCPPQECLLHYFPACLSACRTFPTYAHRSQEYLENLLWSYRGSWKTAINLILLLWFTRQLCNNFSIIRLWRLCSSAPHTKFEILQCCQENLIRVNSKNMELNGTPWYKEHSI